MSTLLKEYEEKVKETDRLSDNNLKPLLMGLYGEVGGIMASAKKLHRENDAYVAYLDHVTEEFGDVLWYLTALCRRKGFALSDVVTAAITTSGVSAEIVASDATSAPVAEMHCFQSPGEIDDILLELGRSAASLLDPELPEDEWQPKVVEFSKVYLRAVQAANITFDSIVRGNMTKVRGRFLPPDPGTLIDFDAEFPELERLPEEFRIEVTQRENGRSYLRWKGVFVGDPLTDNIADNDGYRFHDVFHFAHAAVLHWSPTFRALIRHKRKSCPKTDENQDSGRAIVIEEGLSAYIFACAKQLDFFEGQNSISLDLLKTIQNFVRGYEVEQCPLYLWEDALLQGYGAFRQLKRNNGGTIVGNRKDRKIYYESLSE